MRRKEREGLQKQLRAYPVLARIPRGFIWALEGISRPAHAYSLHRVAMVRVFVQDRVWLFPLYIHPFSTPKSTELAFLNNYQCLTSSKCSVELKRFEMETNTAKLSSKHSAVQLPFILFPHPFGGIYLANKMTTYPPKATYKAHKTENSFFVF